MSAENFKCKGEVQIVIDFCLKGIRIRMHFGFFAVIAIMLSSGSIMAEEVLICCALHECGHFAAMRLCRVKIIAFDAYGGGMKITADPPIGYLSLGRELFILLVGCGVNLISSLVFGGLLKMNTYALISLSLCVFNLLPCAAFDGGQAIKAIAVKLCVPQTVFFIEKLQFYCGAAFTLIAILAMLTEGHFNITLPLTMLLILWESR